MRSVAALVAIAGLSASAFGQAQTFTNSTGGAIPDNNVAGLNQTLASTFSSGITNIVLSLNFSTALPHTWYGDLTCTLAYTPGVGPAIAAVTIFTNTNDPNGDLAGNFNFGDVALNPTFTANWWSVAQVGGFVPNNGALVPGTMPTSGYQGANTAGQLPNAFASFVGASGTGTWSLHIHDSVSADTGTLVSWSVTILPTPGAAAMLGLGGLMVGRRRRA